MYINVRAAINIHMDMHVYVHAPSDIDTVMIVHRGLQTPLFSISLFLFFFFLLHMKRVALKAKFELVIP